MALEALRRDMSGTFAEVDCGIMETQRDTPNWPIIANLRADPPRILIE